MGMKVNGTSGLTFPDTTTLASAGQASVRAWVNFNGTGTVAIRASYNVTSITDGGTGSYTLNFTTALPDANYAVVATSRDSGVSPTFTSAAPTNSSSAFVNTQQPINTNYDANNVSVAVFR